MKRVFISSSSDVTGSVKYECPRHEAATPFSKASYASADALPNSLTFKLMTREFGRHSGIVPSTCDWHRGFMCVPVTIAIAVRKDPKAVLIMAHNSTWKHVGIVAALAKREHSLGRLSDTYSFALNSPTRSSTCFNVTLESTATSSTTSYY